MNRLDEIQMAARDIATNIHSDPAKRDAMADDLIKLCSLIVGAVGKNVAGYGERGMNDEGNRSGYHTIYMAGEQIQSGAEWVATEALSAEADLDRYHRPSPVDPCVCGHVPSVHQDDGCTGERYNREACQGGPCADFQAAQRPPVWEHVDRRPAYFRDMDEHGVAFIPNGVQASGRMSTGEAERLLGLTFAPGPSRNNLCTCATETYGTGDVRIYDTPGCPKHDPEGN